MIKQYPYEEITKPYAEFEKEAKKQRRKETAIKFAKIVTVCGVIIIGGTILSRRNGVKRFDRLKARLTAFGECFDIANDPDFVAGTIVTEEGKVYNGYWFAPCDSNEYIFYTEQR